MKSTQTRSVPCIRYLLLLGLFYARFGTVSFGNFYDYIVITYILSFAYFLTIPARDRHLYFLTLPNWKTIGIITIIGIILFVLATYNNIVFHNCSLKDPSQTIIFFPLLFLTKMIFNALPEEFLFRGFLWGELKRFNFSHLSILLIQTILFWGGHWYYYDLPPDRWLSTIPMGLIFGIAAWKTRSLLSSSILHSFGNLGFMIVSHPD
jgi:membrane protease YdiL (CAAX protease family)